MILFFSVGPWHNRNLGNIVVYPADWLCPNNGFEHVWLNNVLQEVMTVGNLYLNDEWNTYFSLTQEQEIIFYITITLKTTYILCMKSFNSNRTSILARKATTFSDKIKQ